MTSKKRFSVVEVLPQLFDGESDIEENVFETEDNVEEDPDYKASFSDENETPVYAPVVSQPQADTLLSKYKVIMVPFPMKSAFELFIKQGDSYKELDGTHL
ncbi:hypothetical protein JOQ06_023343 [Pogonophryne albipinna]|uniref:Uncharacterized protein n=1 Tax=Pogonophryne albipinna TaxID=1090488 RepID=A0AAD6FTS6_9TELE|nr:hypothetical protein JOQ06_023343 [Pogonophryne albipinna]